MLAVSAILAGTQAGAASSTLTYQYDAAGRLTGVASSSNGGARAYQLDAAGNRVLASGAVAVPPAPTGLQGTPGSGQVTLTWTAVFGATSYKVYYIFGPQNPIIPIQTGLTSPTATVTGLSHNQLYTFAVTAVNAVGESAKSSSIAVTTQ